MRLLHADDESLPTGRQVMNSRLFVLLAMSLFSVGWCGWSNFSAGEPAPPAAYEVLIRNGGFEAGFSGWEERDINARACQWLSVGNAVTWFATQCKPSLPTVAK